MAITYNTISNFRDLISSNASSGAVTGRGSVLGINCNTVVLRDILTILTLYITNTTTTGSNAPTSNAPFRVFDHNITNFFRGVNVPIRITAIFVAVYISTLTLAALSTITHVNGVSFRRVFDISSVRRTGP